MTKSEYDVEWCRVLFKGMKEGGMWAVPRSGMIFTRKGGGLVLTDQMPWDPDMPISAEQLAQQQEAEFQIIKDYFGEAGVTVTRRKP